MQRAIGILLAAAHALVRQALALEPSNPHFVEHSARLQEQSVLGLPARDPAVRDGLRQSLAQYREAAAMRPGSPYVWASIAMLKVRLNDMDLAERIRRRPVFSPTAASSRICSGMCVSFI